MGQWGIGVGRALSLQTSNLKVPTFAKPHLGVTISGVPSWFCWRMTSEVVELVAVLSFRSLVWLVWKILADILRLMKLLSRLSYTAWKCFDLHQNVLLWQCCDLWCEPSPSWMSMTQGYQKAYDRLARADLFHWLMRFFLFFWFFLFLCLYVLPCRCEAAGATVSLFSTDEKGIPKTK